MRVVKTLVLPAPAPASTQTGPSVARTARFCASFNPSRYVTCRLYHPGRSVLVLFRLGNSPFCHLPHLPCCWRYSRGTQVVMDALGKEACGGGLAERGKNSFEPFVGEGRMGVLEEAVPIGMR